MELFAEICHVLHFILGLVMF